jgi:hypothetical protein
MGNGGHLVHYCLEILLFEFILSHIINKPDIPAFQTVSVNWHGKWNIVYRNQTKVLFSLALPICSGSAVHSPCKDTSLCQALYVFNIENTILQCTEHGIMFIGNNMW